MSVSPEELEMANAMIELHGAQAISKAEDFVHYSAKTGSRVSASKWLRIMVLIEFPELLAPA